MNQLHYIKKISPGFFKVFRVLFSEDSDKCVGWLTCQKDGSFNCTSGGVVIGKIESIYTVNSLQELDNIFSKVK